MSDQKSLQEIFADRVKNMSLEKPENYVSKLGPVYRPEPVRVAKVSEKELKKRIKEFSKGLARSMWAPIISKEKIDEKLSTKGLVEATQSKYFGNPWLYESEEWPTIESKPALFVLQLNIASLPEAMSKKLGGEGLLQFFYQTDNPDWQDGAIVRIVDTNQPGKVLPQPPVVGDIPRKEKVIIGWTEYTDYPHIEEISDLPEYQELESLCDAMGREISQILPCAYQGDKLGGYPFWTQAGSSSENYVYQLDAGSFYSGKRVPAHAPRLFASDGTGHIFVSDGEKEGMFDWACG